LEIAKVKPDFIIEKAKALSTLEIDHAPLDKVINLMPHRRSPSPGADATKPKYQLTTPSGNVYFKFGLTENEICAELMSYHIAGLLEIPVAKTAVALYKNSIGIASWDIGVYTEPDDSKSYAVRDFLHLEGFAEMCLFDYLTMNEDRHAGNWGFEGKKVAPLFDHNVCFGGETTPKDVTFFMQNLTSAFVAAEEYQNNQDVIFEFLSKTDPDKIKRFLNKAERLSELNLDILNELYPETYKSAEKLYQSRKTYMLRKGRELGV
jgi:hypothetical protein